MPDTTPAAVIDLNERPKRRKRRTRDEIAASEAALVRAAEEVKSLADPEPVDEPQPWQDLEMTFGGRTYTIRPIASHDRDGAYEDSVEFLITATPIAKQVLELFAANRIDDPQRKGVSPAEIIAAMNDDDMTRLIQKLARALPVLVCYALRNTDPAMTPERVKKLSKGALDMNMWAIAYMQMAADEVFQSMTGLSATLAASVARPQEG